MSKNILFEQLRDYFSLVANLLGDVLGKKSVGVYQRRVEMHRKFDSPSYIPKRRLSLGAPVQLSTVLQLEDDPDRIRNH